MRGEGMRGGEASWVEGSRDEVRQAQMKKKNQS